MKKKQAEEARSAANREAAVAIAPKTFALIFFIGENPFQMDLFIGVSANKSVGAARLPGKDPVDQTDKGDPRRGQGKRLPQNSEEQRISAPAVSDQEETSKKERRRQYQKRSPAHPTAFFRGADGLVWAVYRRFLEGDKESGRKCEEKQKKPAPKGECPCGYHFSRKSQQKADNPAEQGADLHRGSVPAAAVFPVKRHRQIDGEKRSDNRKEKTQNQ